MSNRNNPRNSSSHFHSVIHQWYHVIFLVGCLSRWEVDKNWDLLYSSCFSIFFSYHCLLFLWWRRKMPQLCVLLFCIKRRGKGCREEPLHIRHPHLTLTCPLQNSRNKAGDLWPSTKKREPPANILPHYLWPWAPETEKKEKSGVMLCFQQRSSCWTGEFCISWNGQTYHSSETISK